MVDSVAVFPPGFRVTDADGAPVANAKIKFHEAGPGDELTVYADKELATALGTVVRTRADGYPCVNYGSNTTTMVYLGIEPYHIEITDENDQVIMPARDDVRGALNTSDFLTAADASTVRFPNVAVTAPRSLEASDNGKVFNCDPTSSGTFTVQLDLATTLEDGWCCEIRHDGTANHVRIAATQNIYGPFGPRNAFSLEPGESVLVRCTGGVFKISAATPPYIMAAIGRILIESRISADPGAVTARARYIATAIFTAGGITTAVGDIIEATGQGTFIKYTPPTNCGWIAYVKDEAASYQYQSSAWAPLSATQTQMEAATSLGVFATPGNFKWSPHAAKAWIKCDFAGGITTSTGVSSITDTGTGRTKITWSTVFSSANYAPVATALHAAPRLQTVEAVAAGNIDILTSDAATPTTGDATHSFVAVFGDQ